MNLEFAQSKEAWDGFLKENNGTFLQSYDWGEFRKEYQSVWRVMIQDQNQIQGVCQVMEEKSPLGKYLYLPHGPVAPSLNVRNELFRQVGHFIGVKHIGLKTEPLQDLTIGWRSHHRIQPQKTLISKIGQTPEEILESFDGKTRYNVRLAKRRGVQVKESKDYAAFSRLMEENSAHQGFHSYPGHYFERLLKYLEASLFLAYYQDQVIAGSIVVFFNSTITFLHSASNHQWGRLKAPYLVRFTAIEAARLKGCQHCNHWGISQQRFPGVTEFKKGFGGQELIYPTGRELPYKPVRFLTHYLAYWFLKKY